MANTIITPTMIAKEALMQVENNLVMGNIVHRDYKKEFVKVGGTVNIRKPVKFVASDGATRVNQDVTESNTSIAVDKRKHVSWLFSTQDLTLSIAEYSERYIKPAAIALANKVDEDLCNLYVNLFAAAGTAGTTPATFAALAAAGQKMDEMAIPKEGRYLVLNPAAEWSLADGLKGVFQSEIVKEILREAYLGRIGKFDMAGDQNIVSHTKGVATGTPLVNGATQTGASLITDGWTASQTPILKAGDIFTLAGVYAVNPISKASTGTLQQFVATAAANSDGAGNSTIAISPSITTSGAYQTVSGSPADNAAITVVASHAANMAFHKNCHALVMVPLEMPDGAAFKARETHNNISIRVVKDYDISADTDIIRLDILYGVKTIYPDLGVRLLG